MRIYVGNLPYAATEADVKELLEQFGEFRALFFPEDSAPGKCRGFLFATYRDDSDARRAISVLNETIFQGRHLRADFAAQRSILPADD